MAKTYLNTVKYEITAKYEVEGIVEKPDIVGAIFGQSEGLLGEDMDLKELQQAGKLGRIEISVNKGKGKTTGEISIPSSLDQVKTSILAAAVETVEKVGPCDTKITILNISDSRKEKRSIITDRAKQLLQKMQKFESVESSEIADEIKSDIRTQKVTKLNGLVAGPEAKTNHTIIVVEGRADVLKLLSYGINNAVAMNGSNIDKALVKLCKEKEVIVLIDGDRGGDMNVKKLASLTNVNFVSRAPDGKEVEELTQKEILQALKRRVTKDDYLNPRSSGRKTDSRDGHVSRSNYRNNDRGGYRNDRPSGNYRGNSRDNYQPRSREGYAPRTNDRRSPSRGGYRSDSRDNRRGSDRGGYHDRNFDPFKGNYRSSSSKATIKEATKTVAKKPVKKVVKPTGIEKDFVKIKGSLKARFYDSKNKKIKDVKVKDMIETLQKTRTKVGTIAFDGIVTKRLIEVAEEKSVKNIFGVRKGTAKTEKINIYTI
jgi:DNA primase